MNTIQIFENSLLVNNVAASTRKTYMAIAGTLIKHHDNFFELTKEEIVSYLSSKIKQGVSASYIAQRVSVIERVRELIGIHDKIKIKRPMRDVVLPDVLTHQEVGEMLSATTNVKHKAIMALMYSAGLRVGEVCSLRIKDIDSSNNKIVVRKTKGRIDRVVMLDDSVLKLLREYWAQYKTADYLFSGDKGGAYSTRSVQVIVKRACEKAKIKKRISTHSMRHSCFTQLIKDGVDLRTVQRLAGHKNINTTAGYIRVTDEDVIDIKSPIKSVRLTNRH